MEVKVNLRGLASANCHTPKKTRMPDIRPQRGFDRPHRGSSRPPQDPRPLRGKPRPFTPRNVDASGPRGQAGPSSAPSSARKQAGSTHEEEEVSQRDTSPELEVPIFQRTSLALAGNPLPPLSSLASTLSKFTNLRRLNLSSMQPMQSLQDDDDEDEDEKDPFSNGLTTLQFLEMAQREAEKQRRKALKGKERRDDSVQTLGESLTWLNLAENPSLGEAASSKTAFGGLESMKALFVLNLSSCSLPSPPPKATTLGLQNLRALILSHNRLTGRSLDELPHLPNLNTLVLSHNQIHSIPLTLPANFPQLAKLSVSHNRLGEDGDAEGDATLPDFSGNEALREVRLSHNGGLSRLPAHIHMWGKGVGSSRGGRGLEVLDVGHCSLRWASVEETLLSVGEAAAKEEGKKPRGGLKNLTLAGNPDIDDEDGSAEKIRASLPGLQILDGQRIVQRQKSRVNEKGDSEPDQDRKRKRGSGHTQAGAAGEEQDRLLSRAGPAPPSDAGFEDEGDVASDDEGTRRQREVVVPEEGKRGKRGKRSKRNAGWMSHTVAIDGDDGDGEAAETAEEASNTSEAPKKAKKAKSKKDKEMRDKAKKAGNGDEKPKKPSRSGEESSKVKKARVAWDEQVKPSTPGEQSIDKDSSNGAPSKKSSKAQTSVAGIVEVKKQKKGRRHTDARPMEEAKTVKASLLGPDRAEADKGSIFGNQQTSSWLGGDGADSAWA